MLGQRLHFSITKLLSHVEIIEDLDSDCEKHQLLSLDPYILQNPRGKNNNSILDLNILHHEKQGIT